MEPALNKGQLISWKDARGFGFIKPDNDGKEVFLHISALKGAGRRPKVGDIVLYERVTQPDGKVRAANASLQGVTPRPVSTHNKPSTQNRKRKGSALETIISVAVLAAIALFMKEFSPRRSPPIIMSAMKPGCTIKGNISMGTGNKLYHLPGMEDYEITVIDPDTGERWFCTESEAIANGWRKAPR